MKTKLTLPTEVNENKNHLIIFDCTKLFGEEFGNYCDLKMASLEGKEWLKNLANLRQQYKINLFDTAFLLKECLTSSSPLRQIIPKSTTFYNKLSMLKRVRNESQHFAFKATNSATKSVVQLYFDIALDINLSVCIEEYNLMLRRFNDLESGKTFPADPSIALKLGEIEKRKAEIEDQLIEKNTLLLDTKSKLDAVQNVMSRQDSSIKKLLRLNEQKTSAFNELNKEFADSKEEAEELKIRLEEQKNSKESDEINEKAIERIIASLAETISIIDKVPPMKQSSPVKLRNPRQKIGSVWNKPKGKRKITLSVGKRDLVDSRTSKPLDYISEESRMEIAEDWLRVRPTGGRVFVDEEGDAATLLGEALVYLGNISDFLS